VRHWAFVFSLCVSCADPPTEVVVRFAAEDAVSDRAQRMLVEVFCSSGDRIYRRERNVTEAPVLSFPANVPVGAENGGGDAFRIAATLYDESAILQVQNARIEPVPGQRREAWLCFSERCVGSPCAPGERCRGGTCVPEDVVARPVGEVSAADVCSRTAVDAGPIADAGPTDAGASDAGASDTGTDDAGSCDCPCATDSCVAGACVPSVTVTQIETAYDHTCAIDDAARLWCWGANSQGQLGLGDRDLRDVPSEVPLGGVARDVSTGALHTCAVRGDGTLWCWGESANSRLGPNFMNVDQLSPVEACPRLDPGNDWASVEVGGEHSCGFRASGLSCWGQNTDGQLGINATYSSSDDCEIVSGDWARASAGHRHTCALRRTDDQLFCWGEHTLGRLSEGAPRLTADQIAPFNATGGFRFSDLALGFAHACAVAEDGLMRCWGDNLEGRVGAETWRDPPYQIEVGTETDWTRAAAGARHSCGIRTIDGGTVWCWGYADDGQLGIAGATTTHIPQQVEDTGYTDLSAGNQHTCALRNDGTVWCWGRNAFGQLGTSDRTDTTTPVRTCFP
jgi:alpha-tubulin suppressor-like RCC1 family protein